MRALIVGAGAVGQVYGRHLLGGGAEVAFLLKPQHAPAARAGFTLFPLNRPQRLRGRPERVPGCAILTSASEVAQQRWDQVYLTMSSTALRAGPWFAELAAVIGHATLVLLQPGPDDRAFVLRHLPASQIVQGLITVVSYQAPLPGERRFAEPGVAYWFAPLISSAMSGPADRLAPVLAVLKQGRLPARRHRDVAALAPFPTALLMPLLAGLEQAGWSFRTLRHGPRLAHALAAGAEAMAVIARREGKGPPLLLRLLARRWAIRALLRATALIMPVDLEAYLRAHFTKVGDQTRDFLQGYLAHGQQAGLPVETLRQLCALAGPVRQPDLESP